MAIRIQTEKPVIPIEIGEHTFEFDVSDESVKKFRKDASAIQKEMATLDLKEDEEGIEQTKEILKRGYDLILGEGAFEKIYEDSPSVIIVMKYLQQIAVGIEEELSERGFSQSAQEKAQKYLNKKKK